MFDNVCKFLAETFSAEFSTWLLGEPIELTELSPKELSLEPIRADALILLQSEEFVLHLEFQTQGDVYIPFRMADYRLRGYRRFPHKRMQQIVIYLTPTTSELVYQTTFTADKLQHEFEVIRLWEQPTEIFLQTPALLPFAALTKARDKTNILQQVSQQSEKIADSRMRNNIIASAAILAGLVLEKEVIERLLRRDLMRESVIYQSIIAEGLEQGQQQGRQQGLEQGQQQGLEQGLEQGREEGIQLVAVNLLKTGMSVEDVSKVTGLTVEQVQSLQNGDVKN